MVLPADKPVQKVCTLCSPNYSQTTSAVPLAHSTVPQDCARILEERTIRPSYYDRGDDTWIPSLGLFCRLKFPSAAIRAPVLDGTQWSHLLAMLECSQVWRDGDGYETNMCAGMVVHEATCTHQSGRGIGSV